MKGEKNMKQKKTRKKALFWGSLALAAVVLAGLAYWLFGPGFPPLSKAEIAQIEAYWDDAEVNSRGSKDFASIQVLYVQRGEEKDTLRVYAWVSSRCYYKSGNSVVRDGGISSVCTIRAVRKEDGTLKVKKAVFPRDGEDRYPEDIRALPLQVQMKYYRLSGNRDELLKISNRTDDKARAYFGIDKIVL